MILNDQEILNTLVENGIVDSSTSQSIIQAAQAENRSAYDLLLEKDLITDEQIGKLISDKISVPFVNLSNTNILTDSLKIIPESVAQGHRIIAFNANDSIVDVATEITNNSEFFSNLTKKLGRKLNVHFATPRDIDKALRLYKKNLQQVFDELQKSTTQSKPVAKMVDVLIEYAFETKASDIHIEPKESITLVRFRVDGVLQDVLTFPKNLHDQIVTRIKVLSKLRTDEHLDAQDSKMELKMPEESLDIRVSIIPIVSGEKVVLRLLSSSSRQFTLRDLGMNENDLQKVERALSSPHGMILSTGPTGSGKTTSIYAILKLINKREVNISTIEDPVEYQLAEINQIQVNAKTNLTFANGLRSILRQDPDVIFVGEVRDSETADIAVNSALTGHLVLSTLHTNNAATTLPRLVDMGVEPFLISSTVNVIIGQRLVRKICENCRYSVTQNTSDFLANLPKDVATKIFKGKKSIRTYRGKGCSICNFTGYKDRIGIFEILEVNEEIKNLIISKADSDTINNNARKNGMTVMLEDGIQKVLTGLTTFEEVLRVTK